jgi:hypothetical protein
VGAKVMPSEEGAEIQGVQWDRACNHRIFAYPGTTAGVILSSRIITDFKPLDSQQFSVAVAA